MTSKLKLYVADRLKSNGVVGTPTYEVVVRVLLRAAVQAPPKSYLLKAIARIPYGIQSVDQLHTDSLEGLHYV